LQEKRKHHKWRRQGQATKGKKKDPEAIPVLQYGPINNFNIFKEVLSNTELRGYGALGKLVKQGENCENLEPEEPNVDDYDLDDDPYGINKAYIIDDVYNHRKEMNKMKEDCQIYMGPSLNI
jgi:hypothetical protein